MTLLLQCQAVCFLLFSFLLNESSSYQQATTTTTTRTKINGIAVEQVPIIGQQEAPYCFRVSSVTDLEPCNNMLATQIWPSARVAARMVQKHLRPPLRLCELGCGPGAPSIMAAHLGLDAIATDRDELALDLVQTAAERQNLQQYVKTQSLDILDYNTWLDNNKEDKFLPDADLYLLSDVFESSLVAKTAAQLLINEARGNHCRVWVFCQSDRAQRDVFLQELQQHPTFDHNIWVSTSEYKPQQAWYLFNVEETEVNYGA